MPDGLSPAQQLAELLIDRPLAEYVAEKRNGRPRWSWRLISEQLAEDTGGRVNVAAETLRTWYANTTEAAA